MVGNDERDVDSQLSAIPLMLGILVFLSGFYVILFFVYQGIRDVMHQFFHVMYVTLDVPIYNILIYLLSFVIVTVFVALIIFIFADEDMLNE